MRPNSGGQLVALSGLRLVSSEKEESISAWYLDKCWVKGLKDRGTANVQNNTVCSNQQGGFMIHIMDHRHPAFNQLKHYEWKTVILHLLLWLLVRKWGVGGDPVCPHLFYSSWSHLLPCFLCSLVSCLSSCLFRQGDSSNGADWKLSILNARQFFFSPLFGYTASPAVSYLQQVSTPSLAPWQRVTQLGLPSRERGGCCHGNLRVLSREEKLSRKRVKKSTILTHPSFFCPLLLTIHFSLPFSLNWTEHTF